MLISFVTHNHKVLCVVHINGGCIHYQKTGRTEFVSRCWKAIRTYCLLRPYWQKGGEDTETEFLKGFSTYFVLWVFTSAY